jgi:hypothetical protein
MTYRLATDGGESKHSQRFPHNSIRTLNACNHSEKTLFATLVAHCLSVLTRTRQSKHGTRWHASCWCPRTVRSEEPATTPNDAQSSVRFVGDERGLSRLIVSAPHTFDSLAPLHSVLGRARIQIENVRVTAKQGRSLFHIDIVSADGARVSQDHWASVQASVVTCVLGFALREQRRRSTPPPLRLQRLGKLTMNVEPKPTLLSTWMVPPCATAI